VGVSQHYPVVRTSDVLIELEETAEGASLGVVLTFVLQRALAQAPSPSKQILPATLPKYCEPYDVTWRAISARPYLPGMPSSVVIGAAEMIQAFASAHGNRPSMLDLDLDPFGGSAKVRRCSLTPV